MMNSILIVGNGYDLAKGLNTRFSDFFLPIIRQFIIWLENNSNYQPLAPDIQKYCYVLKQKIPVVSEILLKNKDEFFNNIFIQITLNRFFSYINLLTSLIAINSQLYSYTVSSNYSSSIPRITLAPDKDNKDYVVDVIRKTTSRLSEMNFSLTIFWMDIESLIKDIVTDNLSKIPEDSFTKINWYKFYEAIYQIENNFRTVTTITNDYTKYKHVSLKECLHGLNMFKDLFCEYLEKEENNYRSGKPKEIFLKNKFSHIISLNYTSTFIDSLNNSVPNKEKQEDRICFVHGDRESKNIVIGTESFYFEENSRSETNIEKIPFFKFFQKVLNKTDDKYLQWLNVNVDFSLTFFGFSFSQNDFDFIRELIVDDDGNTSSSNQGQVRKHLKSITIYCKTKKDKFYYLVNLAACLGKKHLSSIKSILNFEVIEKNSECKGSSLAVMCTE